MPQKRNSGSHNLLVEGKSSKWSKLGQHCFLIFFNSVLLGTVFVVAQETETSLTDYKSYSVSIAATIVTLWATVSFLTDKSAVKISPQDTLVCLYLCFLGIRIAFTENFNFDYGWLVCVWAAYIAIRHLSSKTSIIDVPLVCGILLISMFCESFWVLSQVMGRTPSLNDNFPATGTFHNPGPMGIYLSSFLPIVIAMGSQNVFSNLTRYIRLASLLVASLMFVAIIVSQSRSAWMGLGISALIALLSNRHRLYQLIIHLTGRTRAKILVCSAVVSVLVLLYLVLQLKKESAFGRVLVWKTGCSMSLDKPVFGLGIGKVSDFYLRYQMKYFENNRLNSAEATFADKVDSLFNGALQTMAEQGIVGLSLWTGIFLLALWPLIRSLQAGDGSLALSDPICILSHSVVIILVASNFSYAFETPNIVLALVAFIAVLTTMRKDLQFISVKSRNVGFLMTFIGLFLGYISTKVVDQYVIKREVQRISYINTSNRAKIHLLDSLDRIYPLERAILASLGKFQSLDGKYDESIQTLNKAHVLRYDPFTSSTLGINHQHLGQFDIAEKHINNSLRMIPNRMYPRYLLAKLYLAKGDFEKTDSMAKDILQMPIKIESEATRQMKLEAKFLLADKQIKRE
ncbi:O-antigen ligase family protein [Dyadobacter chenwenxiniae]|uniref:O-antigen ligase family protein n=1 Tax=Dyadobacter chenwenxiniae TaxID=2906456 RepID=A0A9X1PJX8_9BACT|nr:O-antigen ligase family protein [Dyadobacter chenwenxiniae]MCF0061349.1 O-antigen ligase family protein [Dyadobacter chenwenxiniae]UON81171.1 O-antigen ligase family protein [Dyadobacter chenwenxiniae]